MKKFKDIREKISQVSIEEKNHLSYSVKDIKSAEFIKKELSGLVKADFEIKKKGSKHIITAMPKTSQDEKIIKSFMDDAKIEMLKDEVVRGLTRTRMTNENFVFESWDGGQVSISPSMSGKIMEIHDTLNRDNQELFLEMIVHSKETFDQMVNFCETYSIRGE